MLRDSITGKLCWFGNICPEPPNGNWPRYPLIIAEVDENKAALKRSTVTAIDDRNPARATGCGSQIFRSWKIGKHTNWKCC
jgi:hypothetical protein